MSTTGFSLCAALSPPGHRVLCLDSESEISFAAFMSANGCCVFLRAIRSYCYDIAIDQVTRTDDRTCPNFHASSIDIWPRHCVHQVNSYCIKFNMNFRTCIPCGSSLVISVVCFLMIAGKVSSLKTEENVKWHLGSDSSANKESEITNNYVSGATKDIAMVSYQRDHTSDHPKKDFRKKQFQELQVQIQQQMPKESKFFDEFEGSEFNTNEDQLNVVWLINPRSSSLWRLFNSLDICSRCSELSYSHASVCAFKEREREIIGR